MIEAAARLASVSSPEAAAKCARAILAVYRVDDVRDPAVYVQAIAATFSEYPEFIAARVASPVHGLPSRLKFLPSIAEVREALDAEQLRQKTIVARARWMIQERAKREVEEERRREIAANKVTPERVAQILAARMRPMSEKDATT